MGMMVGSRLVSRLGLRRWQLLRCKIDAVQKGEGTSDPRLNFKTSLGACGRVSIRRRSVGLLTSRPFSSKVECVLQKILTGTEEELRAPSGVSQAGLF